MTGGHQVPRKSRRDEPDLTRLLRLLAALGGADTQILAEARVDAAEMTGRGIAALIPAMFGGLAALITFRYAYSVPIGPAAAAGAVWAVVVLCFDLSLMRAAPDRQLLSRLVTFGSRALVSVLAALTFASAIVIFLFATDITVQIATDQQTGLARYNSTVIVPAYAGQIQASQDTIRADQAKISQASQTAAYWRLQVSAAALRATCEAQGVSGVAGCGPGTGLLGQGRVYDVRLAELRNDQAALAGAHDQAAATQSRLSPQITAAQAALSRAMHQEQAEYAVAQDRYSHDTGLIERWLALSELENTSSAVRTNVWLLESLILVIDLSAVIAKLTCNTPSYNRMLQARRETIALLAASHEAGAAAAADLYRAERAAIGEVHQARLDAWTQDERRRIGRRRGPAGRRPARLDQRVRAGRCTARLPHRR